MGIKRKAGKSDTDHPEPVDDLKTDPRTIFVRGVSFHADEKALEALFSNVGPVRKCILIKEKGGDKHRGFGFVQFALQEDAERAITDLALKKLDNRTLRLELARKRAPLDSRYAKKSGPRDAVEDTAEARDAAQAAADRDRDENGGDNKPKRPRVDKEEKKEDDEEKKKKKLHVPVKRAPPPPPVPRGESSQKQRRARTIAVGNLPLPSTPHYAATLAATRRAVEAAGAVSSLIESVPALELSKAHLEADGCKGHVILVEYKSVREAINAVKALHHSVIQVDGKKKGEGERIELWARQLGGEAAHVKKWRLIVRNLSFAVTEADLAGAFRAAGVFVWECTLPRNEENKTRGFAFIGTLTRADAEKAIAAMNGQKIKGRAVAVDWAVSKSDYNKAVGEKKKGVERDLLSDSDEEEESEEDEEEGGEEEDGGESTEEEMGMSSDDEYDDNEEEEDAPPVPEKKESSMMQKIADKLIAKQEKKKKEENESIAAASGPRSAFEGKRTTEPPPTTTTTTTTTTATASPSSRPPTTGVLPTTIFIRNLALDTTREMLQLRLESFGPIRSCRLVMDKMTGRPKGTAFVDFAAPDAAQRAATASSKAREHQGPAIIVNGSTISVDLALDQSGARSLAQERSDNSKARDRRNLYLADEGRIEPQSTAHEQLSVHDKEKRERAWREKQVKLASPNFMVSTTRLSFRNVPLSWTEDKLRTVVAAAVKRRASKAVPRVKQVKILREEERKDAEGNPRSKGLAFVEFENHEHALCALRELNNNPEAFTRDKRPIVEFAIENVKIIKLRQDRLVKQKVQVHDKKKEDKGDKPLKRSRSQRRKERKVREKEVAERGELPEEKRDDAAKKEEANPRKRGHGALAQAAAIAEVEAARASKRRRAEESALDKLVAQQDVGAPPVQARRSERHRPEKRDRTDMLIDQFNKRQEPVDEKKKNASKAEAKGNGTGKKKKKGTSVAAAAAAATAAAFAKGGSIKRWFE